MLMSNDEAQLYALARCENLLPELQEQLVYLKGPNTVLAQRSDLRPGLQSILADGELSVRGELVLHKALLPDLQLKFARDRSRTIREELARRDDLLPKVQDKLAADNAYEVRLILARNEALAPSARAILAQDELASRYLARELDESLSL